MQEPRWFTVLVTRHTLVVLGIVNQVILWVGSVINFTVGNHLVLIQKLKHSVQLFDFSSHLVGTGVLVGQHQIAVLAKMGHEADQVLVVAVSLGTVVNKPNQTLQLHLNRAALRHCRIQIVELDVLTRTQTQGIRFHLADEVQ